MDNQQYLCQRYLEPNSTYRSVILLVPLKEREAGSPIQDIPAPCPPVLSYLYGKQIIEKYKCSNICHFLLVNVRSCNNDINSSIYNVNIKCVCQEYEDMSHIYVRHIFIFLCINVYIYKCRELDRHGKNCSSS